MNERYGQKPQFLYCHDNSHYPLSVVFFSGLGSTIERQHVEEYRTFCHQNNVSFIALDFTAHAYKYQKNEPQDFGMNHRLSDALNVLQNELKNKPFIMVGFSMGGKLALDVSQQLKNQTKALIELAPAIELSRYQWYDNLNLMVQKKLNALGKTNPESKTFENLCVFAQMLKAVKGHLLLKEPVSYGGNIDILHGMVDKHVPYQNSLKFKKNYVPQAQVAILPGESHHFLQPHSRQVIFNTLANTIKMVKGR